MTICHQGITWFVMIMYAAMLAISGPFMYPAEQAMDWRMLLSSTW